MPNDPCDGRPRIGELRPGGRGDTGDFAPIAERRDSRHDLDRPRRTRGRHLLDALRGAWQEKSTRLMVVQRPAVPASIPDTIEDTAVPTRDLAADDPSATSPYEGATQNRSAAAPVAGDASWGGLEVRNFDDFEILEELGHGGMGIVFRARQVSLDRLVALKTLHPSREGGDLDPNRFREEALAIAALKHPNIVPIHAVGEVAGGSYYSMQLAEGGTLDAKIRQAPIGCREAVRWLIPVAEAIAHAHRLGIIHRDLKPSNILVDREGRPLVADFGLALRIAADSNGAEAAVMAGTPNYMAPEQADSEMVRLTTAVDIYGLGAVLYAMLSGKPPFQGSSVAEVVRSLRSEAPKSLRERVAGLDLDLEAICLRCLQKDPNDRYPSALALVEDLKGYLAGRPVAARPLTRFESAARWARRQPLIAALVATLFLVAFAAALLVTLAWLEAGRLALEYNREAYVANIQLVGQELEHNNWRQALALFEEPIVRESRLTGPDRPGFERDYLGRQFAAKVDSREMPGSQVVSVDYDPTGKRLAAAATDRIRVYDEDRPGRFLEIPARPSINDLAFSPDGRTMAVVGRLGILSLLDPGTGAVVKSRGTDGKALARVAWSRDGKRLATLSGLGVARAWDAEGPAASRILATPIPDAVSISFAQDDRLAVGSVDGKVRIWDLGKDANPIVLEGHASAVRAVAFDAAGALLASGDQDGVILVREAASGKLERQYRGMSGRVFAIKFSPDGKKLAAAGEDQVVWLHDLKSADPPRKLVGHVQTIYDLAFRPDGRRLAACAQGAVKVWDLGDDPGRLPISSATRTMQSAVAVDPGGRWIASADFEGRAWIWDQATRRPARTIDLRAIEDRPESLTALTFAADGRLALGCAGGLILLADPATGRLLGRFQGHEKGIRAIAFEPDGGRFASASDDGTVRLWDLVTGRGAIIIRRINPIWSLTFDPNGGRLAFGEASNGKNRDYPVRIWDLAARRLEASLHGHVNAVASLAYDGDGARLASASLDGTIRVWDVRGRRLALAPLSGHNGCVVDVAFSPDGNRLASAGHDHTIRIWSTNRGQELLILRGHADKVIGLDFTRDGTTLVSAGFDGQVRIW